MQELTFCPQIGKNMLTLCRTDVFNKTTLWQDEPLCNLLIISILVSIDLLLTVPSSFEYKSRYMYD